MISVIIPAYNREKLIRRAIDSVLAQRDQELEIVVVDDASTDGTQAVVTGYGDTRIRYIRQPENRGVDAARNRGLDEARGESVCFLDSDDELLPGALAMLMQPFAEAEVGMVFAPYILDSGERTGFDRDTDGSVAFEDLLCESGMRPRKHLMAILRRSVVGDTRWETRYLQFLFFRYVGARTRMAWIATPCARYHLDTTDTASVTRTRRRVDPQLSIERARALVRFLETFGATLQARCPYRFATYAYGAAVGTLLAHNHTEAVRLAAAAARAHPCGRYRAFAAFSRLPYAGSLLWALAHLKRMTASL